MLNLKRAYKPASREDGRRILVDRLWPRGISKDKAKLDGWMKDVAPSDALRKWFSHDPAKWGEFKKKYFAELKKNETAVSALRAQVKSGATTLVFAAKDEEHNNAVALKEFLEKK